MNPQTVFERTLRETKRKGIEDLILAIQKTDFYTCQCGGHDRYPGGTLNHSLWVLDVARTELRQHPESYPGITNDQLIIVCLLHDLGDTHRGFHRYTGHGRRAALVLNEIKLSLNFDISDLELGAIRWHRAMHIRDDFDHNLTQYSKTPLIRLLKHSDHIAAGVMNYTPFGSPQHPALTNTVCSNEKVFFNPNLKHWYWGASELPLSTPNTKNGDVASKPLTTEKEATHLFGIDLFHFGLSDLCVFKDETGKLALFSLIRPMPGDGALFRTDHCGFGFKTIVIYYNKFGHHALSHYIITESSTGLWSLVRVWNNRGKAPEYIGRKVEQKRLTSEDNVLDVFQHSHHGINLRNDNYYDRIAIKA